MKRFVKYFVNGIITITPIALVIYIVVQMFNFLDNLLGQYLREKMNFFPYIPGIGLLISVLIITLVGWMATQYISKSILQLIERILERIPVIKSLYSIIKETIQSFFGEKRSFSKVARIHLPNTSMSVIGFVTSEEVDKFDSVFNHHIAVYIPQSFQMAGVTVLVPKEDVEILSTSPEDAMRFILSAGMSGHNGNKGN